MNTETAPQVEMVSELQRLSELATAGPWLSDQYDETEEGCPLIAVIEENGLRSPTRGMVAWFTAIAGASFESPERCEANAKFIAALVNWFRENQAALNARAGGDGWLPIESAPKSVADGRRVDGIYLLGFIPDADACDPLSCMDTIWWEPLLPNTAGGRGKWCAGKSDIEVSPTHWQPLPTPPAALASQAVGV